MYPKFFVTEFEWNEPCFGIQTSESEVYIYEGYRLTYYGSKKLEQARYQYWITAKQFTDKYISAVFTGNHQKDCVVSNKVFQILINDDRSMVSKDVVKDAVLKGLSEEYALEEKYF